MNFKRLNNIAGWIVFLIASSVYVMTAEKNGSLWDCGEFVASCYKLQIPHPPGAPLFVILGRFFIILFGDNPATAAKAVNIMSALASGFTILFLFWTITHFARKLVNPVMEAINGTQAVSIIGAGAVGALAYTFSDSFWYSAVEGEVYALSSFFTALVFWAMLKWEHQVDKDSSTEAKDGNHFNADRWIVFIFFMMGLSIGVHLLNLLTIPAIAMIYYFKRYEVTKWGTVAAFLVGCLITGIVQKFVIQYSITGAGKFDIFFVNVLGLPFFSGFASFFVILAVLIFVGLRMAQRRGWYYLRLGLWCFAFSMIGYSSYLTTMIRSSADPGVDMYNVDNPISLVGYLGREQYGDFPLLKGQVFTVQNRNISREEGAMKYQKSKDKYIELGNDVKEIYQPDDMMFFPRVWDRSNDQQHANYYAEFLGIGMNNDPKYADPETGPYERRPTFGDNVKFFIGYQTYWMYLRYFMWNFSGKQNDVQGTSAANVRDGNWKTGIPIVDNLIYGDQSKMPQTIRENKANNKLFALPLILGLIGLFFHYYRHRRDFIVNMLLFFFTGFAIVLYLNQAGNQPRERDYAYVGSFYAFAVWIGLAVPAFVEMATQRNLKLLQRIAISAGIVYLVGAMSGVFAGGGSEAFMGIALMGVFATAVTFGIYYLLSAIKNEKTIGQLATVICLSVAVWMGVQEWDDHDRSQKTTSPDLATDYLESCAPNAVLFSFGDNDTYPLWYAQEVLGVRPDIRVINYSLLGIDWYINQLRYKINNSDAIDLVWNSDQIEGEKLNYAYSDPRPGYAGGHGDLYGILKDWVGTSNPQRMYNTGEELIPVFPTSRFAVPVDKDFVMKNGTIMPSDTTGVVDSVRFEINRNVLLKNDLAVLAVIAANNWKRPIYFTSKFDELGFQNYLRRDGMTYRLVPIENHDVNTEWAFEKMMTKFAFGSAEKKGVYFDEENRRHLNNIRQAYADLAVNLATEGKKDSARKALERVDKMMLQENMPYGLVSRYNMHNQASLMMLEAAYRSEDKALADKISKAVRKELNEEMAYYAAIGDKRAERMSYEMQRTQSMLQMMNQMEEMFKQRSQEQNTIISTGDSSPAAPK